MSKETKEVMVMINDMLKTESEVAMLDVLSIIKAKDITTTVISNVLDIILPAKSLN